MRRHDWACCAVLERTADGDSVGRCWFYVDENMICPRHGDVKKVQATFDATGKLSEDPRKNCLKPC